MKVQKGTGLQIMIQSKLNQGWNLKIAQNIDSYLLEIFGYWYGVYNSKILSVIAYKIW